MTHPGNAFAGVDMLPALANGYFWLRKAEAGTTPAPTNSVLPMVPLKTFFCSVSLEH